MEKAEAYPVPGGPGTQVPAWEQPANGTRRKSWRCPFTIPTPSFLSISSASSPFAGVKEKFSSKESIQRNTILKPWNTINLKRFLVIVTGTLLVLSVGLGVGLGVGMKKAHDSENLPLPNNADRHSGDLTYYDVGLGACGVTSTPDHKVVSVAHELFDAAQTGSNPNQNPLCGQKIRATRFYPQVDQKRSIDLTVVDRCEGCEPTDIDVSASAFDHLAAHDDGRVSVTWVWLTPQATGS